MNYIHEDQLKKLSMGELTKKVAELPDFMTSEADLPAAGLSENAILQMKLSFLGEDESFAFGIKKENDVTYLYGTNGSQVIFFEGDDSPFYAKPGEITNSMYKAVASRINEQLRQTPEMLQKRARKKAVREGQERINALQYVPDDFDEALQLLYRTVASYEEFRGALSPSTLNMSNRNLTRLGRATIAFDDDPVNYADMGDVTIFRACPPDSEIGSGDWVTLNEQYAIEHAERFSDEGFEVISENVPGSHVFTDENDENEQIYVSNNTWSVESTIELWDALNVDNKPQKSYEEKSQSYRRGR